MCLYEVLDSFGRYILALHYKLAWLIVVVNNSVIITETQKYRRRHNNLKGLCLCYFWNVIQWSHTWLHRETEIVKRHLRFKFFSLEHRQRLYLYLLMIWAFDAFHLIFLPILSRYDNIALLLDDLLKLFNLMLIHMISLCEYFLNMRFSENLCNILVRRVSQFFCDKRKCFFLDLFWGLLRNSRLFWQKGSWSWLFKTRLRLFLTYLFTNSFHYF